MNITTKEYKQIKGNDLELAIKEYLRLDYFYQIVAAEELGNHKWEVRIEPASDYDREECEIVFKSSKQVMCSTRSILNCMCSDGLLEAGDYLIDTTW